MSNRADRRRAQRNAQKEEQLSKQAAARQFGKDVKRDGVFDARAAWQNPHYMREVIAMRKSERDGWDRNGITKADLDREYQRGYKAARQAKHRRMRASRRPTSATTNSPSKDKSADVCAFEPGTLSTEDRPMDRETEQRSIQNRDIPLLQNVYAMMQEIVSLEHRRMWQRERMNNITQHLTGMPGGGGTPKGIDEAFAAISELEEEHKNLVKQYARELKRAERIINAIESGSMRAFVSMMYLDNIPGNEVRQKLNLTRWGFERAKEAIEQAEDMAHVAWHERYILGDGNRAENFQ